MASISTDLYDICRFSVPKQIPGDIYICVLLVDVFEDVVELQ